MSDVTLAQVEADDVLVIHNGRVFVVTGALADVVTEHCEAAETRERESAEMQTL